MLTRPLGEEVSLPPAFPPSAITLQGRTVRLVPLAPAHADELYPLINNDVASQTSLWDYMGNGPFHDISDFRAAIATLSTSTDPFFFAIIDTRAEENTPTYGKAIGYISLMSYSAENMRIEIGNVLFTSSIQKTTGATEANYLLLKHAFEDLGYRRVEWKCNALNEGSRRAALRLGFAFEGVFRQHMVIKGRNRDTAWFSTLREEWNDGLSEAFEGWLDEANFDQDGKQIRKIEEFR